MGTFLPKKISIDSKQPFKNKLILKYKQGQRTMKQYLNVNEVAELLNFKKELTIIKLIEKGTLRAIKIGGRYKLPQDQFTFENLSKISEK